MTTSIIDPMAGHRFFAALYDRLMAGSEDAGLADMRAELLAGARGRTLELGAGTGHNLPHYGNGVTELVLTEPDPFMARRLREHVADEELAVAQIEVLEAGAEELPIEDSSVDTVVSTLVLCTVEDPERAVAEIERVLRPGGQLLYVEHVISPDSPRLARWQHRVERPWGWIAGGCHPNRDTAGLLERSGLDAGALERDEFPKAPPPARPLIRGVATHPG
jgi:ubiquinone/menaquinone biosynthesis C-methylase UbiE